LALPRALRLATVTEKTVYTSTDVPTTSAASPVALPYPSPTAFLAAAEPREGVRRVGRPDEARTADGSGAEALRGNVERGAGQRECETFRARSSGSANVTAARRIDVPAYDHAHAQHGTRQRPVTVTGLDHVQLDRPKFVVGRAGIKLQSYVSSLPEQRGIFYFYFYFFLHLQK
jgi:hypothetical protein